MNGIKLIGAASAVPAKIMTNADFAGIVDTSDEWIVSHTGISRRHHCTDETHSGLCVQAAKKALERAGVTPDEIGVCIVATVTGDYFTPSAACIVSRELGLPQDIPCFDLNAACSGFINALHTCECLLAHSPRPFGLVIGAEVLSRFIDYEDRATCILFGDGAGAAIVEFDESYPSICGCLGARGDVDILNIPGVGTAPSYVHMKGTAVFKFAVDMIPRCMDNVLYKAGVSIEDIDIFAFHQANERIIDTVIKRRKLPAERCYKNISDYGNTSSASIPLMLSDLQDEGKLFPGNKIMAVGFGGGLTWGGALLEFGVRKDLR